MLTKNRDALTIAILAVMIGSFCVFQLVISEDPLDRIVAELDPCHH